MGNYDVEMGLQHCTKKDSTVEERRYHCTEQNFLGNDFKFSFEKP
jgi:hypothetical protein